MIGAITLPFRELRRHWSLVKQMTRREIESRFLGSVLGAVWVLLVPVLMLVVYSFVFGVVFKMRWPGGFGGTTDFALKMFAGLIVFSFFGDVIGRAPRLVVDQPNFVKKVAFPLHCLAWVSVGAAGLTALCSFAILIVAVVLSRGQIFSTAFLVPVYLSPLILLVVGFSWILSALGVYFRDLGQFIGVVISALLFLTPVFYPTTAVPESFRTLLEINPLTFYAETMRSLAIQGEVPAAAEFLRSMVVAVAIFFGGFLFFSRARQGFADVI